MSLWCWWTNGDKWFEVTWIGHEHWRLRLLTIDNDCKDCGIDAMLGNPFLRHVILEHKYSLQARKLIRLKVLLPVVNTSNFRLYLLSWFTK